VPKVRESRTEQRCALHFHALQPELIEYIRAMPTINLTDDELEAVKAALGKLEAAAAEPTPPPETPPPGKVEKRAR
jgi:hypothetical protein